MNKKGFISISVVYSFFVVFMMLLLFIVDGYVNSRSLIKKIANETVNDAIKTDFCDVHFREKVCELYTDYNNSTENYGMIYHNQTNENGTNDGSYRYTGVNPNNYVCFGSDAATCPANNLYRIIGLVPVDVVTDATTNSVTTETQMLYKLIKKTYMTGASYGNTSTDYSTSNAWGNSSIYSTLNNDVTGYLSSLTSEWQQKIAKVVWKIGGSNNLNDVTPMSTVYTKEIVESGIKPDDISNWSYPLDIHLEIVAKVGLMYVSDYGYASTSDNWTTKLSNYTTNWLYGQGKEWTITRDATNITNQYVINDGGQIASVEIGSYTAQYRPVIYLVDSAKIISDSSHDGTESKPFRIS